MVKRVVFLAIGVFFAVSLLPVFGAGEPAGFTEIATYQQEITSARIEPARVNGQPGVAVAFTGTDDLHYYADADSATAPGFELLISVSGQGLTFGPLMMPTPKVIHDPGQQKDINVFAGDFKVFVPITNTISNLGQVDITAKVTGQTCTSNVCLMPFTKDLSATIDFSTVATWPKLSYESVTATERVVQQDPTVEIDENSPMKNPLMTAAMLLLALVGGLSFNIMPCVLPVLPLIITRFINITKEHPGRRISHGLMFCVGVISFFVVIGVISSVIRLTTGAAFNLSDPYRFPVFDIIMVLFLVVFALLMFDVFTLVLPSSVAGQSASGNTISGSVGMGFLAGVLSTPCSGAILATVLVWAQTQSWQIGFLVFVLLGVGMALPYAVLISIPTLLNKIPKPGDWMEKVKKAMGFAMLLLMAKPLSALPKDRLVSLVSYAVILAFAVWMWGTWVTFSTPAKKKWLLRTTAALIAIVAGAILLPAKTALVNWQSYDATAIQTAIEKQQPVLIKFTADWCSNCKVVDRKVFHDKQVVEILEANNVFTVKGDTTLSTLPASIDLQKVYGIPGSVPTTVVILPNTNEPVILSGIYDKAKLLELLSKFKR